MIMATSTAPLTDAETEELIELWRRNRTQDPILTDPELLRLDDLAKRIKIRVWPPVILPPNEPRPTITIPKKSQQLMVCDAATGGGGGGV